MTAYPDPLAALRAPASQPGPVDCAGQRPCGFPTQNGVKDQGRV